MHEFLPGWAPPSTVIQHSMLIISHDGGGGAFPYHMAVWPLLIQRAA